MQTTEQATSHRRWATIAEVSSVLGVKRDTIKHAVEHARAREQDWVKREPYPAPGCPLRWLIDTSHVIYQYHERRWRKLVVQTGAKQAPRMPARGEEDDKTKATHPCTAPGMQQRPADIVETWLELCHWFAEHGLLVFVNALAADQRWAWSWGDHAGSGYPNATAAISAALQSQLVHGEIVLSPPCTLPDPTSAQARPKQPLS